MLVFSKPTNSFLVLECTQVVVLLAQDVPATVDGVPDIAVLEPTAWPSRVSTVSDMKIDHRGYGSGDNYSGVTLISPRLHAWL